MGLDEMGVVSGVGRVFLFIRRGAIKTNVLNV